MAGDWRRRRENRNQPYHYQSINALASGSHLLPASSSVATGRRRSSEHCWHGEQWQRERAPEQEWEIILVVIFIPQQKEKKHLHYEDERDEDVGFSWCFFVCILCSDAPPPMLPAADAGLRCSSHILFLWQSWRREPRHRAW